MNIEQIAQEVASEMGRDEFIGDALTEFLRRCLAKLAEQAGEPVGWFKYDKVSQCWHPQYEQYVATHAVVQGWQKLYTEEQLIAAQLRMAEACARYCGLTLQPSKPIPNDADRAWLAGTIHCTDGIRNGEWRKYL